MIYQNHDDAPHEERRHSGASKYKHAWFRCMPFIINTKVDLNNLNSTDFVSFFGVPHHTI